MNLNQLEQSAILVRPAQLGDICVLIEPASQPEIQALRLMQTAMQAAFGGVPIDRVHLTCQRFACADEDRLESLAHNLRNAIAGVKPFLLAAYSLHTLYLPVRQTNILKVNVAAPQELQSFVALVEKLLLNSGIEPLYRSGFISTLVAMLKDIPELEQDRLNAYNGLPCHLFTASQIALSRIDGPDEFEILSVIPLNGDDKS